MNINSKVILEAGTNHFRNIKETKKILDFIK